MIKVFKRGNPTVLYKIDENILTLSLYNDFSQSLKVDLNETINNKSQTITISALNYKLILGTSGDYIVGKLSINKNMVLSSDENKKKSEDIIFLNLFKLPKNIIMESFNMEEEENEL